MFCQNCGKEMNNSMVFCPYCGAKAGAGTAPQAVGTQEPARIKMVYAIIITILALIAQIIIYRRYPLNAIGYTGIGLKFTILSKLFTTILLIVTGFLATKNIRFAKIPLITLAVVEFAETIRSSNVFFTMFCKGRGYDPIRGYKAWLINSGPNFLLTYGLNIILTILLLIAICQSPSGRRALSCIVSVFHFVIVGYYVYKMIRLLLQLIERAKGAGAGFHIKPYLFQLKVAGYPHLLLTELAFALLALAIALKPSKNNRVVGE